MMGAQRMPFACCATALVVALCAAGCEKSSGAGAESGGASEHPLVGAAAPEFDVAAQHGGKRAAFHAGSGKVTIVDFWATWCEPCKESFPFYQALASEYSGKLAIIGISEDDGPSKIKQFAKETGVHFPLAWDENQSLSEQYHPPTMPTSYVIDEHGIVRFVHAGFRAGDDAEIRSMVEQLAK